MLEDNLFPLLKDVSLPLVKVSTPVRKSLDELCLEKCEEIGNINKTTTTTITTFFKSLYLL